MDIEELQNAALETAVEHIKEQRKESKCNRIKMYCLTLFTCVIIICAAVVACFAIYAQQQTIIEQQYALNMQYASLMEYIANAEITKESAETGIGDNGTAFVGDGNTVVGGDFNG